MSLHYFVGKVMSLLFNMLSRLVIAFLLRSKCLLISWLQSTCVVILEPKKIVCHCFHCFPIYLPWSNRTGHQGLIFLNVWVVECWTTIWSSNSTPGYILSWPKSSLGFFYKMLRKNLTQYFLPTQYLEKTKPHNSKRYINPGFTAALFTTDGSNPSVHQQMTGLTRCVWVWGRKGCGKWTITQD